MMTATVFETKRKHLTYPGRRKRPLFEERIEPAATLPLPPEDPRALWDRLSASFAAGAVLRLERQNRNIRHSLPNVALSAFGEKPRYEDLTKLLRDHMGRDDSAEFIVDWYQPSKGVLRHRGSLCIRFARRK
jgi:hypothetical protein